LQLLHQRRGREKPRGAIQTDQAAADPCCQVGFTHTAWAKQQQVLGPVNPASVMGELLDLVAIEIKEGPPVDIRQGFGHRQLGLMQ